MATDTVDSGVVGYSASNGIDSLNNPNIVSDPTLGATKPMDSVNMSSKIQGVDSEVENTNINESIQGATQASEKTHVDEKELEDTAAQSKTPDLEVDESNTSREPEETLDDLIKIIKNPPPLKKDYGMIQMMYSDWNLEEAMPMEWRIKSARKLSLALQIYLRLMEDRVTAIEEGRSVKSSADEEEAPPKVAQKQKTVAMLKRKKWSEFRREHDEKKNENDEFAIDVLVGDPVIPHDVWRNRNDIIRLRELHRYVALEMFATMQDKPDLTGQTGVKSSEVTHEHHAPIPDRIRINGGPLRQLLEKALKVDFKSSNCSVVLLKPYKLLVHHESRIRQIYERLKEKFANADAQEEDVAVKDPKNQDILDTHGTLQAFKELQCLVEFMDSDLKIVKQIRDASITKISFSDLWHVFHPGCEVITSQDPVNAYRVFYVTGGRSYLSPPEDSQPQNNSSDIGKPYRTPDKSSDLIIACYQIDFDGNKFGPVTHSFNIQKYDEYRDITSLPIYPLKVAKKSSEIRDLLTKNGHTFRAVCKGEHVQYRGINLHEAEEIDSEVVVDFHAALWSPQDKDKDSRWNYSVQFGIKPPAVKNQAEVVMISNTGCLRSHCCDNEVIFDDLIIDHQRMEDFLSDNSRLTVDLRHLDGNPKRIHKEDLILFPHRLFAFVLKDRKWAVIDINNVKRVPDPRNEAWNSLVLPEDHKDMVYSVVRAHFRDKKSSSHETEIQTDLIRGKGKGLIILLHGAPGVGKTSTAECVAEMCKRPLYPITCGDLGITAVEVESRLKHIFVQAQKWKCVLLLDEADVFLSERGNDVKHNSLVSDLEQTVDIFKTNLQRVKSQKGSLLKTKDKEIEKFARDHYENNGTHIRWNGRQIRNAFHIAVALAENEAEEKSTSNGGYKKTSRATLRPKHFLKVENASTKFDDYLTSVLGMGHSERAREKSYRVDSWRQKRDTGSQERHGSRRARDKRAYKRKAYEYEDSTSDSTDSMKEEAEEEVEKRSELGESSDGKGRSRSEGSDEEEDSEDGKRGASRRYTKDTGRKRSREKDRDSRTKGRSKKSN
ncbi:hypothetical protein V8C35DRAFT_332900 [Trichoderma chlorosporum]